jgi:hypothetical protein
LRRKLGRQVVNCGGNLEMARRMALELDHAEEGSSYGTPGFKVAEFCSRGCIRISTRLWLEWILSSAPL